MTSDLRRDDASIVAGAEVVDDGADADVMFDAGVEDVVRVEDFFEFGVGFDEFGAEGRRGGDGFDAAFGRIAGE